MERVAFRVRVGVEHAPHVRPHPAAEPVPDPLALLERRRWPGLKAWWRRVGAGEG